MLKHVATAVALHFAQKSGPLASGQGLPQQPPQADLQLIAGSPAKPPAAPPAKPAVAYQPATKAEVMAALGIETPPPGTAADPHKPGGQAVMTPRGKAHRLHDLELLLFLIARAGEADAGAIGLEER